MPVSVTLCGLPVAESVNTNAEDLFPVLVGWKVTVTIQLAPLATEPPQVSVPFVNCVESPPVTAMLEKVTVTPLLFVNVTVWAALVLFWYTFPNAREAGEMVIGATPVPAIVTQSGVVGELLAIHKVAFSVVVVVDGAKSIRIAQDDAGATVVLLAQTVEASTVKSIELAPLTVSAPEEFRTKLPVPVLERLSASEPVAPICTLPNARLAGEKLTCGTEAATTAVACAEFPLVPAELVALTT